MIMIQSWPRNAFNVQMRILGRTCTILLVRSIAFYCLGIYSYYYLGLLVYFSSYNSMIITLRFTDCFSHSYAVEALYTTKTIPDRVYEQNNTFSIRLIGPKWCQTLFGLLLFLNFNLHNEHHLDMMIPWNRLHNLTLTRKTPHTLPNPDHLALDFFDLLKQFHTRRISRLFTNDYGAPTLIENTGNLDVTNFTGVADASFLVLEI